MSERERQDEQAGVPGGEGGGGADGDESFTMGGPRGQDAERGEYYEPEDDDEE